MLSYKNTDWLKVKQSKAGLFLQKSEGQSPADLRLFKESWLYTPLSKIVKEKFTSVPELRKDSRGDTSDISVDNSILELSKNTDYTLIFYNGRYLKKYSKEESASHLSVMSLGDALEKSDLWSQKIQSLVDYEPSKNLGYLGAENYAGFADGAFIYCDDPGIKNLSVAIVHLYGAMNSSGDPTATVVYPRNVYYFNHSVVATIAETHLTTSADIKMINTSSHLVLDDGAQAQFLQVFHCANNSVVINDMQIAVQGRNNLKFYNLSTGCKLNRNEISSRMLHEGSEFGFYSLGVGSGDNHIDTSSTITHVVGKTRSYQQTNHVLSDSSKAVFTGKIHIIKEAQQSETQQLNRNLLLSPEAQANSRPQLEIQADDVKATHGATLGQIEEEQLYYLMSRGIAYQQATEMIALGFQNEILSKISDSILKNTAEVVLKRDK